MTSVIGVSLGHRAVAEADHWIQALDPAPVQAATHLVREPYPHVAISLAIAADADRPAVPEEFRAAARSAAAAHGTAGRAVVYAGGRHLVGTVTAAHVLDRSAIEAISVLGGGTVQPDDEIVTRDFVRPQWISGRLTLVVTPVADARYAPFEVPDPTPCCGDH